MDMERRSHWSDTLAGRVAELMRYISRLSDEEKGRVNEMMAASWASDLKFVGNELELTCSFMILCWDHPFAPRSGTLLSFSRFKYCVSMPELSSPALNLVPR